MKKVILIMLFNLLIASPLFAQAADMAGTNCRIQQDALEFVGFKQGGTYYAQDFNKFIQALNLDATKYYDQLHYQLHPNMPYKVYLSCHVERGLGRASLEAVQEGTIPIGDMEYHKSVYINWTFSN